MRQTTFRTDEDNDNERIAIPLGIIRLVRGSFRRFGFYDLLDGFKESGISLSKAIENLVINSLTGDFSMNDWDRRLQNCPLRREYLCGDGDIRRWTLQRSLERIAIYLEEIVEHIVKLTRVLYPEMPTHAYADGSHVKRYGSKGKDVRYGEGGGSVQLQNQFMVSSMILSGTPLSIESYPGNLNDPQQYNDFIPQLMYLLKPGSLVVMDNGGSNAKLLDEIVSWGNAYITRVKMNASDDNDIENHPETMEYIGMNVICMSHTFESSGRTIYRFFSVDSYVAAISRAERTVATKELERQRAQKVLNGMNPRKLVKTEKNPFFEVVIDGIKVLMTNDPWLDIDPEKELKDAIPTNGGWFKLESSVPMDPLLVLLIYRHRVDIEHLISSLKSVVNFVPMRVWGEGTTRGKLVLVLIAQFIVSVAMNDMEPERKIREIDGMPMSVESRCSPKTFIQELNAYQGILSRGEWGGFVVRDLKDPNTAERMIPVLERYEKEPPIDIPADLVWRSDPPAQWGVKEKNFDSLATSIEQGFSETIFSALMVSRRRCQEALRKAKEWEKEHKAEKTKGKKGRKTARCPFVEAPDHKNILNCSMDLSESSE